MDQYIHEAEASAAHTTCVQAFARLSAVYGGTYMLSKPDAQVVYDEAGKATGVTSEGETVQAKFVVGDPSARRLSLRQSLSDFCCTARDSHAETRYCQLQCTD